MKQEIKEGAAPVEATSAEPSAQEYPIRARVINSPYFGARNGDELWVKLDGEVYRSRAPNSNIPFIWYDHELEIPPPAPSPEPAEAAPAGVELTLMYRDNGETAWWQVIDVPIRGLLKDGETFKIAAALTKGQGSR